MRKMVGFTLIELLVATSIFSIVALIVYSTFNTGILSSRYIEYRLASFQAARRIFSRLDVDLKGSFAYSPQDARFIGKENELSFFALIAEQFSQVSYKFENGTLSRTYQQGLASVKEDSAARARILGKQIKKLEFSYAFLSPEEAGYGFKGEWEAKDRLPLAIKVKLTFPEKSPRSEEKDVEFEKTVFLPLSS